MSETPTEEELNSLSLAIGKLWELDDNRLEPNVHYKINLQGYKMVHQEHVDSATDSLFTFVDKQHFFASPTYASFYAILDNYERETGKGEVVSDKEVQENRNFITQIMKTRVMRYAHNYLVAKGKASANESQFKQELFNTWFALYGRSGRELDSSGFEHVFVGEVSNGKVIGFHNWIQLFLEELRGKVNYKGYILPRDKVTGKKYKPTATERMISLNFDWGTEGKGVSGTFIGTSPEFEIAMYTLCFLCGEEDNRLDLLDYNINIKCYRHRGHLGTSYPELLGKDL